MRLRVKIFLPLTLLTILRTACLLADDKIKRHYPIAATLVNDRLLVANSARGSISLVDTASLTVQSETEVGHELSDLKYDANDQILLATDFKQHCIHLVAFEGETLRTVGRIDVAGYPVGLELSEDHKLLAVASIWSRQLTILKRKARRTWNRVATIDLHFSPRRMAIVDNLFLIAFDGFGGEVAVVDLKTNALIATATTNWHNIRGTAVDGGSLFVTHQTLNPNAHTEREHVHWGVLLENVISRIDIDRFVNDIRKQQASVPPTSRPLRMNSSFWKQVESTSIGEAGNAAGDPGPISLSNDRMFIALSGTNELALIDRTGVRELRVKTGARPVAVELDLSKHQVFVVNQLGHSIHVVNLNEPDDTKLISFGETRTLSETEHGERLFFNAKLSLDGWMSCHSCHSEAHSSHQLADTLGDTVFGNAKRTPSLLGVSNTGPWAWNGSQNSLTEQITKSLRDTMHGPTSDRRTASRLKAYVASLSAPPSVLLARSLGSGPPIDNKKLALGRRVFEREGCNDCHAGTTLTTPGVYNVGLTDSKGQNKFNPPSLRGVSQRNSLLHDGRAKSLSELIHTWKHQIETPMPEADADQLLYYLMAL